MYVKLKDDKLIEAPKMALINGKIIEGFNNNIELLKSHGYKLIEDIVPSFNLEEEYIDFIGYEETEDKILKKYEIKKIPIQEVVIPPVLDLEEQEKLENLENKNSLLEDYILDLEFRLSIIELGGA